MLLVHGNGAFFDAATDDGHGIYYDVTDENLDWVEAAATEVSSKRDVEKLKREMKRLSCRLAAAYYVAAYSPEMHAAGSRYVFYSFPWVVAADVIACGVGEGSGWVLCRG